MALEQLELETGLNKADYAIKLIRDHEPPEGYYLAFSGGKDSTVIYDLAVKAGVKFDAHYCVSPIDPPQVQKFIRQNYPSVQWDYHAKGFWKMVIKKGLPLMNTRWCCQIIKESGGENRFVVVGNRAAESLRRSHQCFVQVPDVLMKKTIKHNKTMVRPILKFTDFDVWQYIKKNKLPYCELYDMGFERIGCILCPFENSESVKRSSLFFPKTVSLWRIACDKIVNRYKEQSYTNRNGKPMKRKFQTGEELYQWWISRK